MNSKKFKDVIYPVREIASLKDMVDSSCKLYGNDDAFLVKDKPGGEYRPISYNQFGEEVNALGTKFIEMGLKGKKIAIVAENCYPWVVTYFATVNGTGVVVPIDRELKPGEIANLLKRAEAEAVLCSKKTRKAIDEVLQDEELKGQIKFVINSNLAEHEEDRLSFNQLIEEGKALVAAGNREFIDAEIDAEVMCSLLFTSGTTGMAKGVMLSHKNIASNVYNMSKYVKIRKGSVGLSVLPMHHTYEMTCHIMTGIYQGMTLAMCEGLKYIQKNLAEIPANVMLAVPLIYETMHKKVWRKAEQSGKADKMRKFANLSDKYRLYNKPFIVKKIFGAVHEALGGGAEIFIAGGAAINPQVIRDYQAMGIPMIQGYGMTENAPIITVNKIAYSKPESVGLPLPGTEVKIVDVDENGVGEIICKGPSVMLGYYKNEEATAETIKDGWLYTGDYGKFDDEGFLYITGRKKSVIVTKNGKNIFPEEIEYYISEYDFVSEVLVHGVNVVKNDDIVIQAEIYPNYEFIKEDMGDISEEELSAVMQKMIDEINDKMPAYKRIKRFNIRKTEFEKTTTRKIKRFLESNLNGGN